MKRFFRIGIVLGLPWAWINASDHPTDVNYLKDDLPNRGLTGYCVDLLEKLSDKDHMDFDYEIVPATKVKMKRFKKTPTKMPDLLKISRIILSYPLADCFGFRSCLAGRCLCRQKINKYSHKPLKGTME